MSLASSQVASATMTWLGVGNVTGVLRRCPRYGCARDRPGDVSQQIRFHGGGLAGKPRSARALCRALHGLGVQTRLQAVRQ
jgi:hypothetical protein